MRGSRVIAACVALGVLLAAATPLSLGAPVTLTAAPEGTAWNSQRKVVRDSMGAIYVAARVPDTSIGIAVQLFRSRDGGATWGALPRVPDAMSEMSRASLAMDSRNRLHLAWTELAGTDLQVFHAAWSVSWTPRTQVSFTPGYSGFPAIGVDHQDRLHVAWYGFDGTSYQVYYRQRGANGTWGPTEAVSAGLQDANNPALALGPDDRPHVAWFLVVGARWSVVYSARDDRWAPVQTLSNASNRALDPSLAVTSAGTVYAAWTEEVPNGTRTVVARERTTAGWGSARSLAWFTNPGGHPAVALDGRDTAYVFWDQLDGAIRFRALNGTWGPEQALAAGGTASFPSPRWAAVANPLFQGANRIDVAWSEDRGGTYAVGFGGVDVPATGTPPAPPSADLVPAVLFIAASLLLAVIVWQRRRIRRFVRRP